jgi:hypothetical protein
MPSTRFRIIWQSGFKGKYFKESDRPIKNKNCLWWPCLLMNQDEMSNRYRGSSIDASYQVSVHLSEDFQRKRLKSEKLTDDRRCTTKTDDGRQVDGKSSHGLWQDELKKKVHAVIH